MENDSILWFSKGSVEHKKLRAEFAGLAMQALVIYAEEPPSALARKAVSCADALIHELAKGDSRGR